MSRLLFNESGRAMPAEAEGISHWRWARKRFSLSAAQARAAAGVWLCLRDEPADSHHLIVQINGRQVAKLSPVNRPEKGIARPGWAWHRVPAEGAFKRGDNQVQLRSESPGLTGWKLAIENRCGATDSHVSDDAGQTWRNQGMGLHSALMGEYLIRLELDDLAPPAQWPKVQFENPRHVKVKALADLLPAAIGRERNPLRQLLRLRTWVASQWQHTPRGVAYAPWDPATVLDWTKQAQSGRTAAPITICVHYGAVFAALATSLGHRARCIATAGDLRNANGHFVTEIWDEAQNQWVLHDPNLDMHFEEAGRRLSAADVCDLSNAGKNLKKITQCGPATARQPKHIEDFIHQEVLPGRPYRHIAVWTRNNYISNPAIAPVNHGPMCYTEVDWAWYSPREKGELGMFPYVTRQREWFDRK